MEYIRNGGCSLKAIIRILRAGLNSDYGIPYSMYCRLIDIIAAQAPSIAAKIHMRVRVQDDRAYLPPK
jgi:hypothetical protein